MWRDSIWGDVAVVDGGSDWRYRLPSRENRRGVAGPYLIEGSAYFEVQHGLTSWTARRRSPVGRSKSSAMNRRMIRIRNMSLFVEMIARQE